MDKVSYAMGIGIGMQLKQMGASEMNIDDFAAAIKDVLAGHELKVPSHQAQQLVQDYFMAQEKKLNEQRAAQGKIAKEAGEKYLAENAKKDGVVTLPSGLQYQVLKEGDGKKPSAKDTVRCHYEGFLIDGTVFDSSVQRGEPAEFDPAGDSRMHRRTAADAGRCQIPFLHPLPVRLRRERSGRNHSTVCRTDFRRGAYQGHLSNKT